MLSRLFGFRGTIGRGAFIGGSLVCLVVPILGLIAYGMAQFNGSSAPSELFLAPWVLLPAWCFLSLMVRRLRDMGWPVLYGLFVVVFITVVGGGLMRPLTPLAAVFGPSIVYAVVMIAMAFPGLVVLALWRPQVVGGGLAAEIEALRLKAEAEGRAPAGSLPAGFGRKDR